MKYFIPFFIVMAWNASASCPQETLKMANQIYKLNAGQEVEVEGFRYLTFGSPNWMKVKVSCAKNNRDGNKNSSRGGNDLDDMVVTHDTCAAVPFVDNGDIQFKVFQCS